jgi:hypothetical protein
MICLKVLSVCLFELFIGAGDGWMDYRHGCAHCGRHVRPRLVGGHSASGAPGKKHTLFLVFGFWFCFVFLGGIVGSNHIYIFDPFTKTGSGRTSS